NDGREMTDVGFRSPPASIRCSAWEIHRCQPTRWPSPQPAPTDALGRSDGARGTALTERRPAAGPHPSGGPFSVAPFRAPLPPRRLAALPISPPPQGGSPVGGRRPPSPLR